MENHSFLKLCAVWNKIGPFDMNLFSHRLILQKKIFLLQELGEDFQYNFRKYLRGPYCSSLATDGYKIKMSENINGKDSACSEINIQLINKLGEEYENDFSWFELIATIVYYHKKELKNKEETKKIIFESKPYLADERLFEEAYQRLIKLKIIS